MSRRLETSADSLELLLDTMCNAFGGIVLLAILVALLSNEVRVTAESTRIKELSTEMLQRRLDQAQRDLASARQYEQQLRTELNGEALRNLTTLLQRRDELKQSIHALTNQTSAVAAAQASAKAATFGSADERARSLREELLRLTTQRTTEQNSLGAMRSNSERLQNRIAELNRQNQDSRARRVLQLRLPKEQPQLKRTFPVILQYGQVYLLRDPVSNRPNTYGLQLNEQANGDIEVVPIRGRGIDLRSAMERLSQLNTRDFYVVCWVYGDSFSLFNQLKQNLVARQCEYGWRPLDPDGGVVLTDRATSAPPPL